ncbi:M20/M25/M40 family metallo-hydrolase [Leptolyngbya sp. 15MV]|nr:M20/M25/M40 family metallo-hydrolase [Leptolyngbya sp. 15MV]
MRHLTRDPIVAAAQVVSALQTIASRNVAPVDAVVVTVGRIEGGTANNIIPERCTLIGTVRTLKDSTQILARQRFVQIVSATAEAMGCRAEVDYHSGYPVTANDAGLTQTFFEIAREAYRENGWDPAKVRRLDDPTMGGEDFSFYGKHVPACFFFLGLRPAGLREGTDEYPSLHQPKFDFNEDAMPLGIEMLCRCALAS